MWGIYAKLDKGTSNLTRLVPNLKPDLDLPLSVFLLLSYLDSGFVVTDFWAHLNPEP